MPVLFIKLIFFYSNFFFASAWKFFRWDGCIYWFFFFFVFLLACFPSVPQTSGHYDVGLPFQAPTSLATGREAGLANVAAYSMSDGRYTRTDSNASPVPSTLSQQVILHSHVSSLHRRLLIFRIILFF